MDAVDISYRVSEHEDLNWNARDANAQITVKGTIARVKVVFTEYLGQTQAAAYRYTAVLALRVPMGENFPQVKEMQYTFKVEGNSVVAKTAQVRMLAVILKNIQPWFPNAPMKPAGL